jgi:hypothetical protein
MPQKAGGFYEKPPAFDRIRTAVRYTVPVPVPVKPTDLAAMPTAFYRKPAASTKSRRLLIEYVPGTAVPVRYTVLVPVPVPVLVLVKPTDLAATSMPTAFYRKPAASTKSRRLLIEYVPVQLYATQYQYRYRYRYRYR